MDDETSFQKGSKKIVSAGSKTPILPGKVIKDKVGKDKDKDKDKLKKGKKKPKWAKGDAKSLSRSARAGVQFPVGRIHRFLKKYIAHNMRVGGTSAVYLTSVMEYLA